MFCRMTLRWTSRLARLLNTWFYRDPLLSDPDPEPIAR